MIEGHVVEDTLVLFLEPILSYPKQQLLESKLEHRWNGDNVLEIICVFFYFLAHDLLSDQPKVWYGLRWEEIGLLQMEC